MAETIVDVISELFPDYKVANLLGSPHFSGNDINFNSGLNAMVSLRVTNINFYSGIEKYSFNSDETGYAIGFRHDILNDLSLKHVEFITKEEFKDNVWHYYRFKNFEEFRQIKN